MPRWHKPHYSARLHGAIRALEDRRHSARLVAQTSEDERQAAAMRGKTKAYTEAIELMQAIEKGWNLPKRLRWTDRRREPASVLCSCTAAMDGFGGYVNSEGCDIHDV